MPNILVSGAASGLGCSLVQHLAQRHSDSTIYALDIQDCPAVYSEQGHTDVPRASGILYRRIDIKDEEAVEAFARDLDDRNVELNLVLHSAGVRGLVPHVPIKSPQDVAKAETVDTTDTKTMKHAFEVNAVGFFILARALIPALRRAAALKGFDDQQLQPPKVAVIGSRMGSTGYNVSSGGGYAYRASKAALNAIARSFSIDIPDVIWTIVHPGRVETGLVIVKEEGAISAEEALRHLIPLIYRLTMKDSGTFVDRFGESVPW